MPLNNRDIIKSINDIGLCLQSMIKTRYKKSVKPIFTKGKYKSLYISFYRSPYVYQFYIEDRNGYYLTYLLKNEKVVKKELIKHEETIDRFYQKMIYFFRIIN
jgi:hypothetical protein